MSIFKAILTLAKFLKKVCKNACDSDPGCACLGYLGHGQTLVKRTKIWAEFSALEVAVCMLCTNCAVQLKCPTNSRALLCFASFILSVTYTSFMLSVIMLNVVAPDSNPRSSYQKLNALPSISPTLTIKFQNFLPAPQTLSLPPATPKCHLGNESFNIGDLVTIL